MKSLLEYKNLIMSTGLIPTIVCMIFCIFFQDAAVLYVCSLASIIYILYRLVKPPVYQPNLVLLHGTLALIIASIIKGISGDMLIPDRTVPITLEILILYSELLGHTGYSCFIRHSLVCFLYNLFIFQSTFL